MHNQRAEYARRLSLLKEGEFQDEISALLSETFLDFQPTISKPQGDGGVDGLSHNQRVAYCCYGLDLQGQMNDKTRIEYVKKKFCEDMQRILELASKKDSQNKPQLVTRGNAALGQILGTGAKIENIKLMCNWFEDSTLIGYFNTKLHEYLAVSSKKYVSDTCTVTLLGPSQISQNFVVSDRALARLSHPGLESLMNTVEEADPSTISSDDEVLDSKYDFLASRRSMLKQHVDRLRENCRDGWKRDLLLMRQLNNDHPNIHRVVEHVRKTVADKAILENYKVEQTTFADLVERYPLLLRSELTRILPQGFSPEKIDQLANYAVAWLIGTCPLDWRKEQ